MIWIAYELLVISYLKIEGFQRSFPRRESRTDKQTNKQTEQHLLVRPTDEGEHSQNKKEEEKEEEGE
jgi:hypothetical protein